MNLANLANLRNLTPAPDPSDSAGSPDSPDSPHPRGDLNHYDSMDPAGSSANSTRMVA